jgi:hypothetical protein
VEKSVEQDIKVETPVPTKSVETASPVEPTQKKVHRRVPSAEPKVDTVSKAEYDRMIAAYELQLQQANQNTTLTRDNLVQAEAKITLLEAEILQQIEEIDDL